VGSGENRRYLKVDGRDRSYLLYIPKGLDRTKPSPVILAFHGAMGTPENIAQITGFNEKAGRAGFIVAYPEGYKRRWNAGNCCDPPRAEGINDVAFVRAILDDLVSVVNIDPQRIFAAGFSNGGKMTYRLACELSERIAAVTVVSSSIGVESCSPKRPVPVLHLHGSADKLSPYKGGQGALASTGEHRGAIDSVNEWVSLDRCSTQAQETYNRGKAKCLTHSNCRVGAEVTLCTIEGMGHQWPGGEVVRPRLLGPGSDDISATDRSIEFFLRHPMLQ